MIGPPNNEKITILAPPLESCYYLSCNSYFTITRLASPTQMRFNRTQITRATYDTVMC